MYYKYYKTCLSEVYPSKLVKHFEICEVVNGRFFAAPYLHTAKPGSAEREFGTPTVFQLCKVYFTYYVIVVRAVATAALWRADRNLSYVITKYWFIAPVTIEIIKTVHKFQVMEYQNELFLNY